MATKLGETDDSPNLAARAAVLKLAQDIGIGQFGSQLCPECEGGTNRERSMSLNVESNGIVSFYCHRVSCGFKGSLYAGTGLSVRTGTTPAGRQGRPLTSDIHSLSDREIEWFKNRFGLEDVKSRLYRTESRYALPILRPNGSIRGYITRRPWEGSPADTQANRNDPQYATKALTYLDDSSEPCLSWYQGNHGAFFQIVLVEDQISAMKLAQIEPVTAVALLGTGLNGPKVAEIQAQGRVGVVIALDADATGQAFAMARKWQYAFDSCRVVVLSKDIKDSTEKEIKALPI